jgi:rubrerythrin
MKNEPKQIKNVTVCRLCGSLFEDDNKTIVKCPVCNSETIIQASCNYVVWALQRSLGE